MQSPIFWVLSDELQVFFVSWLSSASLLFFSSHWHSLFYHLQFLSLLPLTSKLKLPFPHDLDAQGLLSSPLCFKCSLPSHADQVVPFFLISERSESIGKSVESFTEATQHSIAPWPTCFPRTSSRSTCRSDTSSSPARHPSTSSLPAHRSAVPSPPSRRSSYKQHLTRHTSVPSKPMRTSSLLTGQPNASSNLARRPSAPSKLARHASAPSKPARQPGSLTKLICEPSGPCSPEPVCEPSNSPKLVCEPSNSPKLSTSLSSLPSPSELSQIATASLGAQIHTSCSTSTLATPTPHLVEYSLVITDQTDDEDFGVKESSSAFGENESHELQFYQLSPPPPLALEEPGADYTGETGTDFFDLPPPPSDFISTSSPEVLSPLQQEGALGSDTSSLHRADICSPFRKPASALLLTAVVSLAPSIHIINAGAISV